MATAHINIGSNIGDRKALIDLAVAAIELEFNARAIRSDFFESEPWGYDSPNRFINIGINIDIGDMPPVDVLERLQNIQRRIAPASHRNESGGYIDREIDIDLIAIDNCVISTASLQLPHPRMHLREFVLLPMQQIWPNWEHPLFHLTPAEFIARLRQGQ